MIIWMLAGLEPAGWNNNHWKPAIGNQPMVGKGFDRKKHWKHDRFTGRLVRSLDDPWRHAAYSNLSRLEVMDAIPKDGTSVTQNHLVKIHNH